jgi:hypothetical protein
VSDPRFIGVGHPAVRCIEECSELIKIICKAQRFGWHNWHPDDPEKKSNLSLTLAEIADVRATCNELEALLRSPHEPG